MNVITKYLCCTMLFCIVMPVSAGLSDYESGIDRYFEAYKMVSINANSYSIYTDEELDNRSSIVDSVWSLISDSRRQNNVKVREAGYALLKHIQNYDYDNYVDSFDDWLRISTILMDVDKEVSRGTGWGNLVIKICIANKLLNSVTKQLNLDPKNLGEIKLKRLLALLEELRQRLPGRLAILHITLRHYGVKGFGELETLSLTYPVGLEDRMVEKHLKSHFGGMNEVKKLYGKTVVLERHEVYGDYLDLYEKPAPWSMFKKSKYPNYVWELYLLTKILLAFGQDLDIQRDLSQERLQRLLKSEYEGEGKKWMSSNAMGYLKNPTTYRTYLDRVKGKHFVKMMIRLQEVGMKETKGGVEVSPHKFP